MQMFSTRNPKDLKAGVSSGLKSIAKGVLAGTVSLVASPIMGAKEQGIKGFAKGACAGVAGAVVLPVTGVVVGSVQMVRGAVNTPSAIRESYAGKEWDQDERKWREKPTLALIVDDPVFADARARNVQHTLDGATHEDTTDYYELLGVDRGATRDVIKKQYFLLAKRYHPDKNPGNEASKEIFQKLGEAYQVLSDPELRARYDARGREGVADVDFMASGEFFTMLFGSARFEAFTGELMLTTLMRYGGDITTSQRERLHQLRLETVSKNLLKYVDDLWQSGEADYRAHMKQLAEVSLGTAEYGSVMLLTLGRVYRNTARRVRGNFVEGFKAGWDAQRDKLSTAYNAASAGVKVMSHQQKLERKMKEKREEAASSLAGSAAADVDVGWEEAMEAESLPLMLDAMWAANALDIQSAVSDACRKVLKEKGAPKKLLQERAEALEIMGDVFLSVGKSLQDVERMGERELSERQQRQRAAQEKVERAMLRMVQAQDEREHGGHDVDTSPM